MNVTRRRPFPAFLLAAGLVAGPALSAPSAGWRLPVEVRTLKNGLTVVVSPDHGASGAFGLGSAQPRQVACRQGRQTAHVARHGPHQGSHPR